MISVRHNKYKILLVDDDPSVLKIFRLLLEFDGHEVQTVDSGNSALAMIELCQFDLIITDYLMPGMKGDELAALIKKRLPDQPIILTSGSFTCASNNANNPLTGVDCFLNKPFTLAELRDAIIWVIDHHAESRKVGLGTQGLPGGPLPHGHITRRTPGGRS